MSETAPQSPRARRARWPKAILLACLGLALLLGGALLATRFGVLLPQARLLIEARTDGLELGRFGKLHIEGLSGDVWRDFQVARLTVADEHGVWLEAADVHVRWDYGQLFFRRLQAEEIRAGTVWILRRPTLTPKTESPGMPVTFDIDALQARVEMRPEFSYVRGVYDLTGELEVGRRNSGQRGRIAARSVLHPGDHLDVRFQFGGRGPLKVAARALEAEGGALAGALGLPADQAFALQVDANGGASEGRFSAAATSGGTSPLVAHGAWKPQGGRAEGRLVLTASRLTQDLAQRFGPEAQFAIVGERAGQGLYALTAEAKAENLQVAARGLGNIGERRTGPAGLAVSAATAQASRILEWPPMAAAQASGVLTGDWRAWRFEGAGAASEAEVLDYRLQRVSGPITVARRNQVLTIETRLAGTGGASENLLGAMLGPSPTAELALERLGDGRWLVRDLKARGSGLVLTGSGGRGMVGGLTFKGEAQITNLPAARIGASGVVDATWRANRGRGEGPWLFEVEGRGRQFASGFSELDRILGQAPALKGFANWRDERFTVTEARLDGAHGRADFEGVFGPRGGLDFKGEWSADGPFRAGPVEISGSARGAGVVLGTLAAPRVEVTAKAAELDLPQLALKDAAIALSFEQRDDGASGRIEVGATSDYGPARAASAFRFPRGGVDLTDLTVDAAGVRASGAVSLRRNSPSSADLQLSIGPGLMLDRGEVSGRVRLADAPGGARGELDLRARGAVPKGAQLSIASGRLTGEGPLSRLPYVVQASGASSGGRWSLDGRGVIAETRPGYGLDFQGGGRLGDRGVSTAEAAVFRFGGPAATARVRLVTSGGGRLDLDARHDESAADLRAQLTRLDLQLFNEDLAGRINGVLALRGRGDRLDGVLDATLEDARGRGTDPEHGLDGALLARLSDNRLTVDAEAANPRGLRAAAHLELPAAASAAPLRLALDRRRPIKGQFQADGEVRPLWDLLVGGERSLSGRVQTRGTLGGTLADPRILGQARVEAGRFEDAVSGLTLQDVAFSADFAAQGIDVTGFQGRDPSGGTVDGSGRISLGRNGESSFRVNLKGFRLIDNELATASASGQATINRAADGRVRLVGKLALDRADIAANPPTPTGVVTMEVVERNKPEALERPFAPTARQGPAVALDVSLSAPRRVFLRGRGLDVEFGLDAHVGGTTARPALTGVARVVRGDYEFAGKRFEFDDRGMVYLASNPEAIRLDLAALREDPSLAAEVRIRGTAAKPEITLTSRPVLPSDEVLSQVLFGRSASQLSTLEAAQLASALSALAGGGGFDVIGGLRTFAGLDRLALVGGSEEAGVMVAGGKYLTDDVYLELIGGGRQGPAAQVEWRVSRRMSVLSRLTGQGDSRLAVRWRRDY